MRGIAFDGIRAPTTRDATGRPSYRSTDGSDLPARVRAAIDRYREEKGTRMTPRHVLIGQVELQELYAILRLEASLTFADMQQPITICGVRVVVVADVESLLRVE